MSRAHQPGQATIEFALSLLLFLVLVVGALDLGRAVWTSNTLGHAASEAARYGSVPTRTTTEIKAHAVARATGLGLAPGDVTVTRGACGNPAAPVIVTVDYDFAPIAPGLSALWGGGPISMNSSARMYVEQGVLPCAA